MPVSIPDAQRIPVKEKLHAYWRFLGIIWRANPKLSGFRFSLTFFSSVLQPIEIYAFAQLISAITSGKTGNVTLFAGLAIGAYGLRWLVSELTYSELDSYFERTMSMASQQVILEHVATLQPEALNQVGVRRSLDFVREDLWRLNRLPWNTEWLIRSVFKLIGVFGLAFVAPWWVTVLAALDAVLSAINLGFESNKQIWESMWNSLDGRRIDYARFIFLKVKEFREIRLLGAENRLLRQMSKAGAKILGRFKSVAITSMRNRMVIACFHIGAYAAVVLIIGKQALTSPALLGGLYLAINLFSLMGEGLGGLSGSVSKIWVDLELLTYVDRLLRYPSETSSGLKMPAEPLVIEFDRVSYRYPGAKKDALHDVSLTIKEGEHLAMVGENGAGKSTFMRLLSGLDKPTKGRILVNGIALEKYQPVAWRQALHLMTQDSSLFQDFVAANLTYGQNAESDLGMSFNVSTRISGADTVIESLPQKEKTFLGNWAAPPNIQPHEVSGGQAQRLVIARTFIHGGRILALDEPTSAMDANAETRFFERLHQAMQNKGLIFISHRFSTVSRANRILVFDEGRLTEQGTHEELLANQGKYAELYQEQAKWYV